MRDVYADDHGRRAKQPLSAVGIELVIDATRFHVDFECHVGQVLWIVLADLIRLHAD